MTICNQLVLRHFPLYKFNSYLIIDLEASPLDA